MKVTHFVSDIDAFNALVSEERNNLPLQLFFALEEEFQLPC